MAANVAELEKDRYRAMREADLATLDALLGEGFAMGDDERDEGVRGGITGRCLGNC